jgi:hypothetical protein
MEPNEVQMSDGSYLVDEAATVLNAYDFSIWESHARQY